MKLSGCFIIKKSIIFHYIFLLISTIYLEGCAFTWIGRSVGSEIGKPSFNNQQRTHITRVSFKEINYGGKNMVEIHKTDSTILTGRFMGYKSLPLKSYQEKYNHFADSLNEAINLPNIGEILFISDIRPARKIMGYFEGFYENRIIIKSRKTNLTLPLKNIFSLMDYKGIKFDLKAIESLLYSDQIPLRSGVFILTNMNQKVLIPCQEIAYARCQKGQRNGKLIGMAIGVIIDTLIVVMKGQENMTDITANINF